MDMETNQISTEFTDETKQQSQNETQEFQVDSEEEKIEVRILIENNQVGGIIGKGGKNVAKVREDSGAFVSILKSSSRQVTERIMVVKGTHDQICNALRLLASVMLGSNASREKKDVKSTDTIAIRILAHRASVGAVIGKGGAVIRETQSQTGARIQVSNEPLPNSTEKTVTISGTSQSIYEASRRVLKQLSENPLRTGTKSFPYNPDQSMLPQFGLQAQGFGAPMFGQALQQQQLMLGGGAGVGGLGVVGGVPSIMSFGGQISTQKIAIPTVCAGCVIGKRGAVIRDLRLQSGTNVSIADPEQNCPNERVVTISGTPQGIQTAVHIIRQLVEQYQPLQQSGY